MVGIVLVINDFKIVIREFFYEKIELIIILGILLIVR